DMSAATHYKSKLSMGDMQSWFMEVSRPRQYMRNAVYVNTGTPRFQEMAHLLGVASTDWTWSLKFGDLDGDGWEDLYVTNGAERFWDHSDLMKNARGAQRIDTPELKALWLSQPKRDDPNLAYRNTGKLGFEEVGEAWGLGEREVSYGAAYADFDNDGDLDLAVNHFDGAAGLYRNGAAEGGAGMVAVRLKGTASNRDGVGATVRAISDKMTMTRYHTLARGFMSANDPRLVHFGVGESEGIERLEVRWPSGVVQVVEGIERGGRVVIEEKGEKLEKEKVVPLLAVSGMISKAGRGELMFDDFERQPLLPNKLSQLGPGIAFADVNGDGWDDFYIGRSKKNAGLVYLHGGKVKPTGEADFVVRATAPFGKAAEEEDMGVVFFDADGDGDLDLYVVSGGVECEPGDAVLRDRLYKNVGLGAFARAAEGSLPDVRDSGGCVAAVDFDRDGDVDLFVGGRSVPGQYPVGARSRLLVNDGKGVFEDGTPDSMRGAMMVTGALWSDVDGDGWVDLLLTSEWGEVLVYRNVEGELGEGEAVAERGWWNSVTGGDLDGDGDIDYVVGNAGGNTKYRASEKKPVRIYYGDFDGSGERRIVEAKVGESSLLPVRG
ncbi:MAG: VCBS repeat-containing protein, partial [Verrucomicrobiales bacterium]|nr:VCBS repeat-containing protein [Verrucomicrobiales bacterium]